jgi:hypothetical protein
MVARCILLLNDGKDLLKGDVRIFERKRFIYRMVVWVSQPSDVA